MPTATIWTTPDSVLHWIDDNVTRREFIAGGLAASVVLAACGADEDRPSRAEDSEGSRAVRHMFGETSIAGTPQRVVTVGLTDQDAVFALGVVPVASQAWYADQVLYPWAAEALEEIDTEIIPAGDLNIEAVAAFEPDLILAISTAITQEQYDLLSEIAPTIAASADYDGFTTPWQDQTRVVGRALGVEEHAEELIAEVEGRFAAAAARHPEWDGAEAVLASQYIDGQLLVYPADNPASAFLTSLGFMIAPALDEFMNEDFGVPTLSAERLDLIDVDLILWDGYRHALEDAGLFDVPTFANLDAVKDGRMVFPEPAEVADALSFRNVLSLPWALDQIEDAIVAAFDGDPATTPDPED